MSLSARLALVQLKNKRSRTVMTVAGIVLATAMLTAVCGYAESAKTMIYTVIGRDYGYPNVILALGAVLGAIIITASVIVVSNSFRVSAGERLRQFGILKSVGATRQQIARTILYEGAFLGAIGVPIGIIVGLLVELLGTAVVTGAFNALNADSVFSFDADFPFVVTPWMFIVAVVTSFGTVLLSAWLPARKAAKIPAIDAIYQKGEVEVTAKSVRVSGLTRLLFGFEGTLAAKSLKRSRRNFRATVASLTVSIVMLMSAGSFGTQIKATTNAIWRNVDATATGNFYSNTAPLSSETAEDVTRELREYPGAEIFGVGVRIEDETVSHITTDERHYAELCELAGAPPGSNILINHRQGRVDGKYKESAPHSLKRAREKYPDIQIGGELKGSKIPNEIKLLATTELCLLVPKYPANTFYWFAKTRDSAEFTKYCDEVIQRVIPAPEDGEIWLHAFDISKETRASQTIVNTVMFFVYGFVGMLTLIALTSVISTVSANVRSRSREFAVLESVGMTKGGVRKMLNLESVLSSVRSLILGIPLGTLGAFGICKALGIATEFPFRPPLREMAQCVAGVFVVTWATMRFAASRLRRGSVIDAIRGADDTTSRV